MSVKGMTRNTMKKMLTVTLATVVMGCMKPHTQLVLRQMTENFLNSLMAIWKTLRRLHSRSFQ